MLCGEPVAESVMVMAAVRAPVNVGAKCPWMVQLFPADTVDPQEFPNINEVAFAPVTPMPVMKSADSPVLVRVTVCVALPDPTRTVPKDRLLAESDTVVGIVTPVPLSAIVCGDPVMLSKILMAAVNGPVAIGAKWP